MIGSNGTENSQDSVRFVEIDQESAGQRLDNYLIRILKGVPRSRIYRIIRKGEVRLNKGRVKPETRLTAGDSLRLPPIRTASRPAPPTLTPRLASILEKSILYEDNVMLIINKPAGLAVHGGSGVNLGLIEALRAARPDAPHLELAHRLDRDTSGCLMIAKRRSYQRRLQAALSQRGRIRKVYQAVVHGRWPGRLSRINAPLERNILDNGERVVRVDAGGKQSLTEFRVLFRSGVLSVVEAMPATGRTHQIRAHCRHGGYPVVGDDKYGDREADRRLRRQGYGRMMLHAARLEIPALGEHPAVTVEAPMDEQMQALVDEIEKQKIK